MPEPVNVAAYALQPGEQTTEYAANQQTGWWAKLLMVFGLIGTFVPQIALLIQGTSLASTPTGVTILSVLGVLMAVAGAVTHAAGNNSYNAGRALVKAAAVRDVAPETAIPVPPAL